MLTGAPGFGPRLSWTPGAALVCRRAAAARLVRAGETILTRAQAIAPLRSGALVGSGRVTPEGMDGGKPRVRISFDTPYAVAQHERTDYRHAPGRRAGFLREALEAAAREGV